LFAGIEPA